MKSLILSLFLSMPFLVVGICGIVLCRTAERRDWNEGICPKCGKPLKHFGTDSQGGEGWCCGDCGYFTWVTYKRFVYKSSKSRNNDKGRNGKKG